MPRLAILADIHGNLPALEAVLNDLAREKPDAIVVAGDAICWGPQSREVLELLREWNAVCVRGNNEYYLLDWETPRMPEAWRTYGLLAPMFEDLGEAWRHQIALWPDSISLRYPDAPPIHVCHGRPGNPWRGVLPDDDLALPAFEEPILIAGHTHLPMDTVLYRKRVINPGSVGVPMDGDRRAQYAWLDSSQGNWYLEFRRVGYDEQKLADAWRTTDFITRNGPLADLVVREFETAQLQVIPFLAFRYGEGKDLSDADARARFTEEVRLRHTPIPYRVPRG